MLGERQEVTPDLLDAVQEAGKDRLEALAEPGLTAFAEPEATMKWRRMCMLS